MLGVGVWVIIAEYLLEDGGGGHRAEAGGRGSSALTRITPAR